MRSGATRALTDELTRRPPRFVGWPSFFAVWAVSFNITGGLVAWLQPSTAAGVAVGHGLIAVVLVIGSVVGVRRVGVFAGADGLVVRTILSTTRAGWDQVLRQEPRDGAMDTAQVLVLVDGRRLDLPTGMPPGLVDD